MSVELTADEYRAKAKECADDARESFERSDTDGCVTQFTSDLSARKYRLAAEIADNGGKAWFPALFDLEGNRVRAKLIPGAYGPCWAFCDESGLFTGKFVSAFPKRESTMAKKGYREDEEEAEAYADFWSPPGAKGLGGLTSVQVIAKRKDKGYPENAV